MIVEWFLGEENTVFLDTQSLHEESTLRIYSLSGQLLQQTTLLSGSYFNWQPSGEAGGFYFFALVGENGDVLQQGKLVYLPK